MEVPIDASEDEDNEAVDDTRPQDELTHDNDHQWQENPLAS